MLRLLDPVEDRALFEEAYGWRSRPKKHVQPDRMKFETFASNDPRHITIGLFSNNLDAVYFLHEISPTVFESHFTSRRGISRAALIGAAEEIIDKFFLTGASEIHAWVRPKNTALINFVKSLRFTLQESVSFCSCGERECGDILPHEQRLYAKYAVFREPPSV